MIEVKELKKTYSSPDGELVVLDGVNLRIREKSSVVVMGASGSGKTTLLNIIAGLDKPKSGEVLFNGENIFTLSLKERAFYRNKNIGMIFQFFNLLNEFTALENIAIPLIIGGENRRESFKKAEKMLKKFGLYDRKEHRPYQLSGGEQQRVAIARALIKKPRLLLLDEPTGNLDWKSARETMSFIKERIKEESITAVLVTHSYEIARDFGEVYKLKEGKLIKISVDKLV